ncbi:MAG TPA: hypothetical protein VFZ23_00340 [Pyrinomonadaceae bacterium]
MKRSISTVGILSLFGLVGSGMTVIAQSPTIAKDVNVVNTPSVIVTNPVTLASAPVTVRGEETVTIFEQVGSVGGNTGPRLTLGPVNVSAYKQIRIVAVREFACPSNAGVTVTPYLRYGPTGVPSPNRIRLDTSFANDMNRVYELPGHEVEVQLEANLPECGVDVVRVLIYGRRN